MILNENRPYGERSTFCGKSSLFRNQSTRNCFLMKAFLGLRWWSMVVALQSEVCPISIFPYFDIKYAWQLVRKDCCRNWCAKLFGWPLKSSRCKLECHCIPSRIRRCSTKIKLLFFRMKVRDLRHLSTPRMTNKSFWAIDLPEIQIPPMTHWSGRVGRNVVYLALRGILFYRNLIKVHILSLASIIMYSLL